MKDRMMLGEEDFKKAVLVVMILLVTLVCLHVFVMQTDATELAALFTSTTPVENSSLIQMGDFQTTNHQFMIS